MIGLGVADFQYNNHIQNTYGDAKTNGTPNYDIPNFHGKYAASLTSAAINRAKWEDYKNRFQPYEQQLFNYTGESGQEILKGDIQAARHGINNAFNGAEQAQEVALSRFGIAPNESQQNSNALKKAAALAASTNQARENHYQRELEVLSGGIGSGAQGVR
jgi:hypothetical protein